MAKKGWKNKKTPIIVGTETAPTKMESGQVIINKKATKQNLNKLIEINNDGLDSEKSKVSTDGTDGGILKGKPHYDSKGNSLGGIPVIVDGGKKIEVEGEEFVVNKEASQKHWKELSKINQSAGNGVPINPSDVGSDEDPQEFRKGGTAKIIFNPNHIPNKWIYSYAKKVKEEYPKVWDMGGNIFGNEAFKNLERVIKRGYWTDNEEWMYIKWQSYVARHHKDFRIAGTVAMLKWVDKTDKGWDYMKALIDKEVAKKYPKKGFKRKLSGGGGVGKIFELTTYFITADSDTDSDIIYKGIDFEEAKKEFESADFDFNSGGIIIFNKKTDKYKFVGDLENGEYEISDFPLEEYYKDKNYYKLYEEGDFESIDSKDIDYVNKKADELLTKVYNHFGKKYNIIWLDKDETISLNLRIADHSGKWKNKGTNDYFLSIVISDKNPTEKFYKSSPEGLKRDEEEIFRSDATFEEIIDFINNKIKEFQENEDITNYEIKYKTGGGVKDITCKSCNWSWNKSDSEKHDEYVCHKCGADNKIENPKDFMQWYIDWNKTINKKINISFSLPNIIQPFKESNVVILDLFEKIDQKIDAKQYLNKIIENADKYGVVIYLEPIPRYKYFLKNIEKRKKISKDYLISYYQKFGFQLTTNGRFMKRLPKPITDNKKKDGGKIDNFDYMSLFEESKDTKPTENIYEKEREEQYQKSNYSKRWASTFKEAVEKTVKSYLDAKATYEDWGSRQYKSNKGVVYSGGDDIHGNAYTVGGINEYRRKKTMAGAKMQMDEELETLKNLGLSQQEIADLIENKMEDGGSIHDLIY